MSAYVVDAARVHLLNNAGALRHLLDAHRDNPRRRWCSAKRIREDLAMLQGGLRLHMNAIEPRLSYWALESGGHELSSVIDVIADARKLLGDVK